ncbi:MAG: GTPase domain-containing protein [Candidatus Kariarchaeaceae archaeon]
MSLSSSEFLDFLSYIKENNRIGKIVLLGDGSVGKTTIIQSIINRKVERTKRTPFMNCEIIKYDDLEVQVYDLSGQRSKEFHPLDVLTKQIVSLLDIIILVFSVDNYQSFENIYVWFKEIKDLAMTVKPSPNFILVGNKIDSGETFNLKVVEQIVENNKEFVNYFETSGTEGTGLETLNDAICETITKRLDK